MLMRLFSYIVARDYGFAPNPFYGCCTLATCKPEIRAHASVGDWVVGTGAKTKYRLSGHLVYAMKVDETMGFESYWSDPRFLCKRPVMNGSLKQLYGDNIYRRQAMGWVQVDSHHSLDMGRPNPKNVARDTRVDRLLISHMFVYFGGAAPPVPEEQRHDPSTGKDLCCPSQGHRVFSQQFAVAFEAWLNARSEWGVRGMPAEFPSHNRVD